MKPNHLPSFGLVCLLLLVIMGGIQCSKKSNNAGNTNQYTAAEVVGVYTITDMQVKANNQQTDIYSQLTSCAKKDTYDFESDGVYKFGGAADQTCADNDDSGTWSLSGTIITVKTPTIGTSTLAIASLTATQMVLTYTNTYNGAQADFTTTFTKQ